MCITVLVLGEGFRASILDKRVVFGQQVFVDGVQPTF
jgi:hypothetical protein